MPTFDPTSTARVNHEFQDTALGVPYTFAEGHALTAPEALQLNRYVATAVGNAWGAAIRRQLAKVNADRAAAVKAKSYTGPTTVDEKGKTVPAPATFADIGLTDPQATFDAAFASYSLGVRATAEDSSDPTEKMVRSIATLKVKALIQSKGLKVRDFQLAKGTDGETSKFNELVDNYIAKNTEWLASAAAAQLAAIANGPSDDIDIGEETPAEPTVAAAA